MEISLPEHFVSVYPSDLPLVNQLEVRKIGAYIIITNSNSCTIRLEKGEYMITIVQ